MEPMCCIGMCVSGDVYCAPVPHRGVRVCMHITLVCVCSVWMCELMLAHTHV